MSEGTAGTRAVVEQGSGGVPGWLRLAASIGWRVLVVAATAALVVWLVARLYLATAPVVIALFLATVAVPASRRMEDSGVPRTVAAAVTVVGGTLVFLALIGVVVPLFVSQLGDLGEQLQEARRTMIDWLRQGPLSVSADQIDQLVERATGQARENAGRLVAGALTGVALLGEIVAIVVLSIVVLFFFVRDAEQIVGWILRQVPEERRDVVQRTGRRAWQALGAYMRGITVIALVDAVAVGVGLAIIGVPLAVPLALLTFFGAFVPIVGAVTAGVVAALVALVTGGLVDLLLVTLLYVGVQQLEGNLLQPVVMGRAVHLHPVVVLLVLTAGATVAGIAGAFLAVPLAAVLAAVGNELRRPSDPAGDPGA